MGTGRARTDEEKRVVINRIYKAWTRCRHLRFGQFLENVRGAKIAAGNQYYAEDEEIAAACERYADQYGSKDGA